MPKRKVSTTGSPWDPKRMRIELVTTVSHWKTIARRGIIAARAIAQKKLATFFVTFIFGATVAAILVVIYEWVMEEETAMSLLATQLLERLQENLLKHTLSRVFPEVVVDAAMAVVV